MSDNTHYGRKRSGIRRELKKKLEQWLESIKDKNVRNAARKDVIVTGGAIASMLLGEPVNDFDIYFRTLKTTEIVAKYYVDIFNQKNKLDSAVSKSVQPEVRINKLANCKGEWEERVLIWIQSAGVAAKGQKTYHYFEGKSADETVAFAESTMEGIKKVKKKYVPIFMSQNAITLSGKFQIVIRFYGEPEKIHDNYDFVHAMCYWDHSKEILSLPAEALEALLSRTLIYRGSLYPVASIFRIKKFIERGWRITAGQQLKIMWQINEIDLKNKVMLREQLTGVDMAYMYQLIQALDGINPEKINSAYVSVLIDKIFD